MIRFSKYIWLYFLISGLLLVPGIYSLFRWGLRPAIDFTGGILVELKLLTAQEENIKKIAQETGLIILNLQATTTGTTIVRLRPTEQTSNGDEFKNFQNKLKKLSSGPEIVRQEEVGPILGKELLKKTMIAAIAAITIILAYIAYAFRSVRFGVAAIVALLHDLLVIVGVFSLLGHFRGIEVDTLFVTAVLTTMSFSVHDTIVVFDRIREYLKKEKTLTLAELTDRALMETMNRSLINSLTIIFMLLALVLFGGETIRWFALALLVGTISGTYSSPFIATPVLILWQKKS